MVKVVVSDKQIISIEEFMNNYLGVVDYKGRLTHRSMCEYLFEKGIMIPERVNFNSVNKESLLNGTYIVVKDKNSQVLIYRNPRYSLGSLLQELQSSANLSNLRSIRRKFLEDVGYREGVDGVFKQDTEEEYLFEKPNRSKQFIRKKNNLFRKKHY